MPLDRHGFSFVFSGTDRDRPPPGPDDAYREISAVWLRDETRLALNPASIRRSALWRRLRVRAIPLLSYLLVAVFLPAGTFAQDGREMIGKRVVQKLASFRIRLGEFVAGGFDSIHFYRVEQISEGRVKLEPDDGGPSGWTRPEEVIAIEDAVAFFTEEIKTSPHDAFPYTMRGLVRKEMNERDLALADLNESARIEPGHPIVYNNRGLLLADKGNFDAAMKDFDEAIKLYPKYAAAYSNRAQVWAARNVYAKAFDDVEQAIRLGPNVAGFYAIRARIWGRTGAFDKSLADLNEAIRIDPRLADAYIGRAFIIVLVKKDHDHAIADFNEAIKLDPGHAIAYDGRARSWLAKQEYASALADFTEAIRINPKAAASHNTRAWLLATCRDAKFRDGKKALESATTACEVTNWKQASFLDTLAAALAETGDFEQAVKRQNEAIDLSTTKQDKAAYRTRLELYLEKKPYHVPGG
jgi:tetratricopeptide (TPR) repeat protein